MYQDNFFRKLVIDNFAGGGGASTGIELALGFPVDIAVNHDADAIAILTQDIFKRMYFPLIRYR